MADFLLQENGDKILLETGGGILLEQQPMIIEVNDSVTVSENIDTRFTLNIINPTEVWGLKIIG